MVRASAKTLPMVPWHLKAEYKVLWQFLLLPWLFCCFQSDQNETDLVWWQSYRFVGATLLPPDFERKLLLKANCTTCASFASRWTSDSKLLSEWWQCNGLSKPGTGCFRLLSLFYLTQYLRSWLDHNESSKYRFRIPHWCRPRHYLRAGGGILHRRRCGRTCGKTEAGVYLEDHSL